MCQVTRPIAPSGPLPSLEAGFVGDTVTQLRRRIEARFGDRGLTKTAQSLGVLVHTIQEQTEASHQRVRRTTVLTRSLSILIVLATLVALAMALQTAISDGLDHGFDWLPLIESTINNIVFAAIAVLFLWAVPERLERRTLLGLLHRLRSLAHVIDMHQLSKDPEQVTPGYRPTSASEPHGFDAEQLHHYLDYCSELLSLTAKSAALCAEHSSDSVVLSTVSTLETLTTELSNKIWQKISLLPR